MKIALIFVVSTLIAGCFGEGGTCDKSAKEVQMAQNLSKEELESLYKSMMTISNDGTYDNFGGIESIPEQFKFLNPKALHIEKGSHAFLYLKICGLDNKVTMYFKLYSDIGEIKLIWGDGPTAGRMLLWPKT